MGFSLLFITLLLFLIKMHASNNSYVFFFCLDLDAERNKCSSVVLEKFVYYLVLAYFGWYLFKSTASQPCLVSLQYLILSPDAAAWYSCFGPVTTKILLDLTLRHFLQKSTFCLNRLQNGVVLLQCLAVLYNQSCSMCKGPGFSWKNRLEELDLSNTTSACVCLCVLCLNKCVFVCVYVYLQPCIFVSSSHNMRACGLRQWSVLMICKRPVVFCAWVVCVWNSFPIQTHRSPSILL